jgi:3-oxoacyl-[acyl-carrier protein] reductase
MELAGRVALVTGSTGRGMGRSIALSLARAGADLVLNYETRPERAEAVRRAVESMGRRALVAGADVSSEEGAASLFEAAISTFGRVDILVLSAGGPWRQRDAAALRPAEWRQSLAEELHSPLHLIPRALPGMRERRWGRIILLTGEGLEAWPADAALDYGLGKAGREWLVQALARRELAQGITVNAIAPTEVPYVELAEALADLSGGEAWRSRTAPRPQDAGEAAAFLCSEGARFLTGSLLRIAAA